MPLDTTRGSLLLVMLHSTVFHRWQVQQYQPILLSNMKATIDIADSLLRQVRKLAAERNTTIKAIVEAALRDALANQERRRQKFRLETHTFDGDGLQRGLSWDDWSEIRSQAYEGRGG